MEEYGRLFEAIEMLLREKREKEPILISIDGMSGSGKSSLADLIQKRYACSVFHMDDFFLRPVQRTARRLKEPGGNVDYERFKEEVLCCLANKKGLTYRPYSCCQQMLLDEIYVPYRPFAVIEGSYSQHPFFENPYDMRIFMEISREEQRRRIRERNGEEMLKRFIDQWIPMENAYFEEFGIREKADVVIDNEKQK